MFFLNPRFYCICASDLKSVKLIGKDLLCLRDFTPEEIKHLLWTAFDIKKTFKRRESLKTNIRVTLLLDGPCLKVQLPLSFAAQLIGARVTTILNPLWEKTPFIKDTGKMLSIMSDVVICKGSSQRIFLKLADGCSVPIVNAVSVKTEPIQALTDLFTIQSHFGYLRNLNVAWVGPVGHCLNCYLTSFPKMGMNICYSCACNPDSLVSPEALPLAQSDSVIYKGAVQECLKPTEAIGKRNVIITTKHDEKNLKLSLKDMESAADDWMFIHTLPRGDEVDEELFNHKNSFTWVSYCNRIYVYAAVILRLTMPYEQKVPIPNYDNYKTKKKKATVDESKKGKSDQTKTEKQETPDKKRLSGEESEKQDLKLDKSENKVKSDDKKLNQFIKDKKDEKDKNIKSENKGFKPEENKCKLFKKHDQDEKDKNFKSDEKKWKLFKQKKTDDKGEKDKSEKKDTTSNEKKWNILKKHVQDEKDRNFKLYKKPENKDIKPEESSKQNKTNKDKKK